MVLVKMFFSLLFCQENVSLKEYLRIFLVSFLCVSKNHKKNGLRRYRDSLSYLTEGPIVTLCLSVSLDTRHISKEGTFTFFDWSFQLNTEHYSDLIEFPMWVNVVYSIKKRQNQLHSEFVSNNIYSKRILWRTVVMDGFINDFWR